MALGSQEALKLSGSPRTGCTAKQRCDSLYNCREIVSRRVILLLLFIENWLSRESNPDGDCAPRDFKSLASAYSATEPRPFYATCVNVLHCTVLTC